MAVSSTSSYSSDGCKAPIDVSRVYPMASTLDLSLISICCKNSLIKSAAYQLALLQPKRKTSSSRRWLVKPLPVRSSYRMMHPASLLSATGRPTSHSSSRAIIGLVFRPWRSNRRCQPTLIRLTAKARQYRNCARGNYFQYHSVCLSRLKSSRL